MYYLLLNNFALFLFQAKILVTTGVRFRKAFGNRCVLKTEIVSLKRQNNNNNDKSQPNQDILNDFTCRGGAVGGLLRGKDGPGVHISQIHIWFSVTQWARKFKKVQAKKTREIK